MTFPSFINDDIIRAISFNDLLKLTVFSADLVAYDATFNIVIMIVIPSILHAPRSMRFPIYADAVTLHFSIWQNQVKWPVWRSWRSEIKMAARAHTKVVQRRELQVIAATAFEIREVSPPLFRERLARMP